jgi:hypothetical protein
MNGTIYYSKAVMGGGKSYSSVRYFCEQHYEFGRGTIYCVPTKELAKQICESFQAQKEEDYSDLSEFEFDIEYAPDGKPLNIHIKVINGDTSTSVSQDVAESIKNPQCDFLIITHEALFSIKEHDLHSLKKWNLVIDEDPYPLKVYSTQDSISDSNTLSQLASEITGAEKIIEFDVNDEQRTYLTSPLKDTHGSTLNANTKSYLGFLTSNNDKICLLHKSDIKTSWFGIEFLALNLIVQNADEVTLLCSKISILTKIYLDRYDIEIKKSWITPAHTEYPVSLQKKITVHRIWDIRDHSLNHMNEYGTDKISSAVSTILNGHDFITRTNNDHHKLLKSHSGFKERIPKITNGLNNHSIYNTIIDIGCYNQPSDSNHFYAYMDDLLGIDAGVFKKGVIEKENLEPSAQAVCRLGFRKIKNPPHSSYLIIVPDKRTEDYLKEYYLPEAIYAGSIIKDGPVDKGGRKSGLVNTKTAAKVAEVDQLMAEGKSLNEAVKIVGIGKGTYNNFKRKNPKTNKIVAHK